MTIKTAKKTEAKPTTPAPAAKPSAPKAAAPNAAPAAKVAKPPFTGISLGEFKRMTKALVNPKEVKTGNKQLQSKQARTRLSYCIMQALVWMGVLRRDLRDVLVGNPFNSNHQSNAEASIGYLLQNLIHAAMQAKVKVPGLGKKVKFVGTISDNLLRLDESVTKLGEFLALAATNKTIFPITNEAGEVIPNEQYTALQTNLAQAIVDTYALTRQFLNKSAQDIVTAHGKFLIKDKGAKFFEAPVKAPLTPEQEAKRKANAEKLKAAQAKAKAAKEAAQNAAPPPQAAPKPEVAKQA